MQMIKLRPDWLISRRRRWGVPLCALRSASGVLRDKRADRRTSALIKANKPHMWGELKVLPRGYNPKR